jgi:hypothetical protein
MLELELLPAPKPFNHPTTPFQSTTLLSVLKRPKYTCPQSKNLNYTFYSYEKSIP